MHSKSISRGPTIVLLIFITTISLVFAFLYFYVTNNYFNQRAVDKLLNVNEILSQTIDTSINSSHIHLTNLVTELGSYTNVVREMQTNPQHFALGDILLIEAGVMGVDDLGRDQFESRVNNIGTRFQWVSGQPALIELHSSTVTIFAPDHVFINALQFTYRSDFLLSIRVNDFYFWFNAVDYFSNIIHNTDGDLPFDFFIVDSITNLIFTSNQDVLDLFGSYNLHFDQFFSGTAFINSLDPNNRNRTDILTFRNVNSFVSRSPIANPFFIDNRVGTNPDGGYDENYTMMLFTIYRFDDLRTNLGHLLTLLILTFIIVIVIHAILSFYIINYVKKRTQSTEGIKDSYLRNLKTYTVEVTHSGILRNFNNNMQNEIIDVDAFRKIDDFKIVGDIGIDVIMQRKESFVASFRTKNEAKEFIFIKFEFIKTLMRNILVGQDVSLIVSSLEHTRELAFTNQVTNLPNKNQLLKTLNELFSRPSFLDRNNSLVEINISQFKFVNQIVGVRIGDRILFNLASEIKDALKKTTFNYQLYNTQADSFVILFTNVKQYSDVINWADKFLADHKATQAKSILDIILKVGIFNMSKGEDHTVLTVDNAMESLQQASNAAKDAGSGKAVFDSSLGQISSRKKIMEQDLIEAIKNEDFIMYLQPQLRSSTNKIIGFEALIRWNNPKYINESPAKFIEIAESNGMILDIGRIIMKRTFEIAQKLQKYSIKLSMNISPVQILQAGFATEFIKAFNSYGLERDSISIEITETVMISSYELILSKLKLLRDQGINIHLDDFGTGYSSLLYLKELPINAIKIDRGFSMYLETDKYSRSIVQMISSLGKNLSYEIIAEGIERKEQIVLLSRYGVDVIQGYYISKAIPFDDALKLVIKTNGETVEPKIQIRQEGEES